MVEHQSDSNILTFPKGFLWGTSNSAFQSEGEQGALPPKSDWEAWARLKQNPDLWPDKSSGHYRKFREDFKLLKSLGQNSHRFSLEWARIEPQPGEFDQTEISHYREVLQALKENKLKAVVTLLHFTQPAWFADLGGWENRGSPKLFERFVSKITEELGDDIDLWITINEPNAYAAFAYVSADFPPQKKNPLTAFKVLKNLAKAHTLAYYAIKNKYPQSSVGFTNAIVSTDAYHKGSKLTPVERYLAKIAFKINHLFYSLTNKKTHDFIGIQYYESRAVRFKSGFPWLWEGELSKEKTGLGWNIYPKGLYMALKDFSKYHKPIYITENGIATNNDEQRVRYLVYHLQAVHDAISEGVDIKGYFYWSAFDNMELHRGYDPKFGLITVDFKTHKRSPKPSAYIYQKIIDNNGIPLDLLRLPDFK